MVRVYCRFVFTIFALFAVNGCVDTSIEMATPTPQQLQLVAAHDALFKKICLPMASGGTVQDAKARAAQNGLADNARLRNARVTIGGAFFQHVEHYRTASSKYFVVFADGVASGQAYSEVEGVLLCAVMIKKEHVDSAQRSGYVSALKSIQFQRNAAIVRPRTGLILVGKKGDVAYTSQDTPPGLHLLVNY